MKDESSNIAVLIMAAGKSSRFGSPKQLLKWKESNLLQHAIQTASDSNVSDVFLVLGANYDLIVETINTNHVEVIRNLSWEKGLGNSIAFGIKYIIEEKPNLDGVLIMLADQPLIDSEYLNKMIDKFEIGKNQIVSTLYKNKKNGVPAIFDKVYFQELTLLKDDEGAKHIISDNASNGIPINHNNWADIDTFEDYEKLYNANHQ